MKDKSQTVILFLQLHSKLPVEYFLLYKLLSAVKITLIPVKSNDLFQFLDSHGETTVVLFEKSLKDRGYLFKDLKIRLEYLIRQQKIKLVHFTSFQSSELEIHYKHKEIYKFLMLPLSITKISVYLSKLSVPQKKADNTWPGKKNGSVSFLK